MTEVRRAHPGARRQAVLLVILGAVVGALLIAGFEHYRTPLHDWLLSEPEQLGRRVRVGLLVVAAGLSLPVLGFATYLWSIGTKVVQAEEFPPPGYRVIRDTRIIAGPNAVLRGRTIKALALCLAVASALLWLMLWWVARVVSERAA